MAANTLQTDVLIIGAGPTGLMLANQLQRFDIDFIIIDKKNGPTKESRALTVTARSMELYQQLGLIQKFRAEAAEIHGINIFWKDREKVSANLDGMGDGFSDFTDVLNTLEQSKNESILYERLTSHNEQVLWEYGLVSFTQDSKKVNAVVQHKGETIDITAKYMVGCDGASSLVRHGLNLSFSGGTYENRFYVVDTTLEWPLPYDQAIMVPGRKVFTLFFPLKGDRNVRIIGSLPREWKDRDDISYEDIESIIKHHCHLPMEIRDVRWHSSYKLHHRAVEQFRKGRVFLAGDSAHVHSPAGGQGMNTGLQDAHNLAWKLAFVLKGSAPQPLLDTYNEERLPFAKLLLRSTDQGFKLMAGPGWWEYFLRRHVILRILPFILNRKFTRRLLFKTVSQISYDYGSSRLSGSDTKQKLKFSAGDRLPYNGEGYLKPIKALKYYVIHISNQPLSEAEKSHIQSLIPMDYDILEHSLDAWSEYNVQSELFVIVRPDHYIAYVSDQLNASNLGAHLNKFFIS